MAVHQQADLARQRLLRFKLERDERKEKMQVPIYQRIISIAAKHFALNAKEMDEFIIDSDEFTTLIINFCEKNGRKSLFFLFQEADAPGQGKITRKSCIFLSVISLSIIIVRYTESGRQITNTKRLKRVLVSDGEQYSIIGQCIYIWRVRNDKAITVENISDETLVGVLDSSENERAGSVLKKLSTFLEKVLIGSLRADSSWNPIPNVETANEVRHKFLTSIEQYQEFLNG